MIIIDNDLNKTAENLLALADEILNGQNLKPWKIEMEIVRWDVKYDLIFGTDKKEHYLVFYTAGDSLLSFVNNIVLAYLNIRRKYDEILGIKKEGDQNVVK